MPKEKDWAWGHGTVVVERDRTCAKCNYCSQVFRGGITALKKHLGRIQGFCPSAPEAVIDGFRGNFEETGPYNTMKLKSDQKKVPLCEGEIDNEINEEPGKEVAKRVAERLKVNLTEISSDLTPIINVEDSSGYDETGLNTSLADTSSKKRRIDDACDLKIDHAFGLKIDDAFGPHQRIHTTATYP